MRKIDLYDHNKIAFEKAEAMLQFHGKAAIIHPTGTGKSFIAFALIEKHPEKKFVWLAPSEYIYYLQTEKLWTKQHVRFNNVKFFTYNQLMWHEELIKDLHPDYIILDEFHRAGAREWGKSAKKLLDTYPNAKVLGLTATNIRYLDDRRDMADEIFDGYVASEMSICDAMARGILPEPKYVIGVYSYEAKIRRYQKRIESMQNGYVRDKSQKLMERLRHALERADGMCEIFKKHLTDKSSKLIVFCSSLDHLYEMVAKVPEWFYDIDMNPHIYRVYSSNPESEEAFCKFKDDDSNHLKLLFCIDMLNEGIHVDGVKAVVLCRPTISPIVYKQQIGRAIASGNTESPIIFDLVNNFESLSPIAELQDEYVKTKGLMSGAYRDNEDITGFEVIDELSDCRLLMEQIQRNIETSWDECYKEYARYVEEKGSPSVPKRYITDDGFRLGKWVIRQREKHREGRLDIYKVEMLEKLGIHWSYEWDENFEHWIDMLRKYKDKYGDVDVPFGYVWEDEEMQEDISPPNTYVTRHEQRMQNNKLGQWCSNLRRLYRDGKMLPERVKILEDMGFSWERADYFWNEGYKHAVRYYEENGNLDMNTKYVCDDGYKLGGWINRQRKVREGKTRGILTDERISKLDELGMAWKYKPKRGNKPEIISKKTSNEDNIVPQREKPPYSKSWYNRYVEAKAYYEMHGNLHVTMAYCNENNSSLYEWLGMQKNRYLKQNHGDMTDTQVKMLEEIDITHCRRMVDYYEKMVEVYRNYVIENNDNLVPTNYVTPNGEKLGNWLANQRAEYRIGNLDESRIKMLEEIGIEWRDYNTVKAERYWDEMYNEAKKYADKYGSIENVPHGYVTDKGNKLGQWISQQRGIRKGTRKHSIVMDEERIARLDVIGMNWNPPPFVHKKRN